MCQKLKILARAKSGELSFCTHCKSFHLVFNNLFFAFSKEELKCFKDYIDGLDIAHWEKMYECSTLKRKIPLPTSQENLIVMFNRQEIVELRHLLAFNKYKNSMVLSFVSVDDIDYKFLLN